MRGFVVVGSPPRLSFLRAAAALLAAALFFAPAARAAPPPPPTLAAESYILLDAQTAAVLAEKNADLPLPPASLTKIMTTYLAFAAIADGRLAMTDEVEISQNAWGAKTVGSKMFLQVGSRVLVEDLLRGVIVQSGNDAAVALAEAIAGDEPAFARRMNAAAARMQLANTAFANSTGLPAKGHYSSARDIALLSRQLALDFPQLYRMHAEGDFTHNNIRQSNRNPLLGKYAGADGIKTGYTKAAGYCLAASAVRDGRRLIAVVMKTDSNRARAQDASKLLNYGFNDFETRHLYRAADSRAVPLWKGAEKFVAARPQNDGVFVVGRNEKTRVEYAPRPTLVAPLAAGAEVGELRVWRGDVLLHQEPLVAAQAAAAGGVLRRLYDGIKLYWKEDNGQPVFSEW